ncbi:MAG: siderophore-interacting protein [Propionibacteriaceae bacterium]|nr:siderophore-interacting protein [Propionibacteriaceae bacterium]
MTQEMVGNADGGRRGHAQRPAGGGGRQRLPHRKVRVASAQRLSEHLVELVVEGELDGWQAAGAGGHFKVFVPDQAGGQAMRTYTVRRFDADAGRLAIDFALHDEGPAAAFARTAAVGDEFEISGLSRPGFELGGDSEWIVLIADLSALPAVCAIAESLPAGLPAMALVEAPDQQLAIASDAALVVRWLEAGQEPCQRLAEAALALALPEGPGEVWVGCEAAAMRTIRRHLLGDLGLPAQRVHTRAYWKRGVAGHSDHDTGADADGGPGRVEPGGAGTPPVLAADAASAHSEGGRHE